MLSGSIILHRKPKDGQDGAPGAPGEDAVSILVTGTPLTYATNSLGIVSDYTQTASITVMKGSTNVTANCTKVIAGSCVNCNTPAINWTKGKSTAIVVKITSITNVSIAGTDSNTGEATTRNVSSQAGYATVKITYDGVVYQAQVPFQVNLALFTGGLYWDNQNLTAEFHKTVTDTGGLVDQYSAIKQDYSNISLKVGEQTTGRVNLLRGSACKRQGEGWAKMSGGAFKDGYPVDFISTSMALQGVNTLVCKPYSSSASVNNLAGFHWIGNAPQGNIPIVKGEKYTLSFWGKTSEKDSVVFVVETLWAGSLTDTTRPAGYAGPTDANNTSTAPGTSFSASSNDTWQLFTYTIQVPTTATYDYLEICIFARSKTYDSVQHTAYICRPMMECSAKYNGWTLSPDDKEQVGGNMLDNTRLLRIEVDKNGNSLKNIFTVDGTVSDNAYENNSTINTIASSDVDFKNSLQWEVETLIADIATERTAEDYTLSFTAKGSGTASVYLYGKSGNVLTESSSSVSPTWKNDGVASFVLTSDWQRYWVHWSPINNASLPTYCLLRAQQGCSVTFTQPKLERGATATAYTSKASDQVSEAELLDTGIDVMNKKIVVTTNQFEIQNNAGVTTATVDANGRLTVTDGEFKGTVRAQNFYHGVYIFGVSDPTYYCRYTFTSDIVGSGKTYTKGQYYTAEEASLDTGYVKYLIPCSGSADVVILPHSNASNTRYVTLPCADDYEGKIVEVIDTGYCTNNNVTLAPLQVGAADDNAAFALGLYTSGVSNTPASLNFNYTAGKSGIKVRFLSVKIENEYYWVELDESTRIQ